MDESSDLTEIRERIDRLDDDIVALLALRQRQVERASALKTDDTSVRAPERRAQMMERLRGRAIAEGVDPEVVTRVYTAMIDAFVERELRELEERRGSP